MHFYGVCWPQQQKKIETFYRHFCDIMGIVKVFTTQSEHDTAEHVAQQGA